MAARTSQLMTWTFSGPRFESNGVKLDDLTDLVRLRDLIVELTKSLWKRDNPERERLPKNFEKAIVLEVFSIEKGSAAFPICFEVPEQVALGLPEGLDFDESDLATRLPRAARVIEETVRAAAHEEPYPHEMPRSLLTWFGHLGSTLGPGERILISAPGRVHEAAVFTPEIRDRLVKAGMKPWTDAIDIEGVVTAANVSGKATLEVQGSPVDVAFPPEQERLITQALHERDRVRLRIRGRGVFEGPLGRLRKVDLIDSACIVDVDPAPPAGRPLWELADELAADVSDDEWRALPTDLAANVDHYLYGRSKRSGN